MKKILKTNYLQTKRTVPAGWPYPICRPAVCNLYSSSRPKSRQNFVHLCFQNHSPAPVNKGQTLHLPLEAFFIVALASPSFPHAWPSTCVGLIVGLVLHFTLQKGFPFLQPLKDSSLPLLGCSLSALPQSQESTCIPPKCQSLETILVQPQLRLSLPCRKYFVDVCQSQTNCTGIPYCTLPLRFPELHGHFKYLVYSGMNRQFTQGKTTKLT